MFRWMARRRPRRLGWGGDWRLEPRLLPAVDVLTYRNDNARTGQNLAETTLTPANVNASSFGRVASYAVDGEVYAQPLVLTGVEVPGRGTRDVVIVATQHDSVYAFDAAPAPGVIAGPLWRVSFLDRRRGVTTVPSAAVNSRDIAPEVGITSTPVIDRATNTVYVVAKTREARGGRVAYVQRLHALDAATGGEKFGGPVPLRAAVPGRGEGSAGGLVPYNPLRQNQRAGLALSDGVVYVASGGHGDTDPYHGWILGYDARTLRRVAAFNATPDGTRGGIWQAGAAPAFDAEGNLFAVTANGTYSGRRGRDYGDSVLKLATRPRLRRVDSFTPFNEKIIEARDAGFGSSGILIVPDQPGPTPRLLVLGGKDGKVRVLDRDDLGGHNPRTDAIVQSRADVVRRLYSTPAYFNGRIYIAGGSYAGGEPLQAYRIVDGRLADRPEGRSPTPLGSFGASPSISADVDRDAIVWALDIDGYRRGRPPVLRAFDAADVSRVLYGSDGQDGRDEAVGAGVKFTLPTVANGRVYVGSKGGLTVYGLL